MCLGQGVPLQTLPVSLTALLQESTRVLDAGVRLLDTADIYAPAWNEIGHNELFVAHALATWSAPAETKKSVLVATKGGITRADGEVWGRDGSREHLVRAAEASRERLGVNTIQLWQHHRLDASLDFETQVEKRW